MPARSHGMSRTRIYRIWKDMRGRCYRPTYTNYKYWGGRGITVCERWSSFEAFYEDIGLHYKHGLTLERKNNDGNYEPTNCVWASHVEQNRNTRRNTLDEHKVRRIRLLRADGMYLKDIARDIDVSIGTIGNVLYGHAWKEVF